MVTTHPATRVRPLCDGQFLSTEPPQPLLLLQLAQHKS